MKKTILLNLILLASTAGFAQGTTGCTDKNATNYNAAANINDGSCTYRDTTLTLEDITLLNSRVKESSGLLFWDNKLWTHVDDTHSKLYAIDTTNGNITDSIIFTNIKNIDWESIQQDSVNLYIGDFGNNASGNRQNLKIYIISKTAINSNINIDSITFKYEDQISFNASNANQTDFDAEAFIVTDDSIYIFTKQWVSQNTKVYQLPKLAGNYIAKGKAILSVNGLITDAFWSKEQRAITLIGYSSLLRPFIYLIWDINSMNIDHANKRRINLNPMLAQTEAITSLDGLHYWVSTEEITRNGITLDSKLYKLNLSHFLQPSNSDSIPQDITTLNAATINVYPNPANSIINIELPSTNYKMIYLYNSYGVQVMSIDIKKENNTYPTKNISISTSHLAKGLYLLKIDEHLKKIIIE